VLAFGGRIWCEQRVGLSSTTTMLDLLTLGMSILTLVVWDELDFEAASLADILAAELAEQRRRKQT